ncbi:hypothetical protein [Polyangium fumosum]|uniref:hypothetical protein n=1 Tax=Polyangium fumosum TaxID=889272 RepID=UPI0014780D1A|nr:hypothetical protein [Polyangium fumosum]
MLLFGARRSLLTEALLCVHAGRLDPAREVFREVERLARRTTYLRPFLLALDAERRLITGELEGMEALLGTLHNEAKREGHALNQSPCTSCDSVSITASAYAA